MSKLGEQVGAAIRHQRKLKELSQEDLAAKAARSVGLINRLERGRVGLSLDTLQAIAEALGVDVRDLFGVGDFAAGSRRDDGLVRLIGRVSDLGPDDLNWIDDLVRIALARKVRAKG